MGMPSPFLLMEDDGPRQTLQPKTHLDHLDGCLKGGHNDRHIWRRAQGQGEQALFAARALCYGLDFVQGIKKPFTRKAPQFMQLHMLVLLQVQKVPGELGGIAAL